MLFKSIQSIASVSSSSNVQVGKNSTSSLVQGSNKVVLLDNLTLLSNNRNNQASVLGYIFN